MSRIHRAISSLRARRASSTAGVAYVAGPVDAVKVHQAASQRRELSYLGTSYLSEWFSVTGGHGYGGLVITTLKDQSFRRTAGDFDVVNVALPYVARGVSYHLKMVLWALRCVAEIRRFRPRVVVLTAGQNYWFVFLLLRLLRIRVIVALHSSLWAPFAPRTRISRILFAVNSLFYRWGVDAAIVSSHYLEDQLEQAAPVDRFPRRLFLPTYDRSRFPQSTPELPPADEVFRVFYAGRLEENKGVLDLVEIARALRERHGSRFQFHLCGTGSLHEVLESRIREDSLLEQVVLHGQKSGAEIAQIIGSCHVTIVPSRSDCEEGFNMVCAESVLFGRPVVTSAVCPAIDFVRSSVLEVRPDDVAGYVAALEGLFDDPDSRSELWEHCSDERLKFFDRCNGYGAAYSWALSETIESIPPSG